MLHTESWPDVTGQVEDNRSALAVTWCFCGALL